ncbi:MAG TPA: hypothetical protein VIV11_02450 [Kofleriaceae bacterium]
MKRALVMVVLFGLTAQANADDDSREMWRAAFAGSVTVAISGGIIWYHGMNKVEEARDELCASGAYSFEPGCATDPTITQAELDRINAKGDRGETITYVGGALAVIGVTVGAFSFYKGFIEKPKGEDKVVVVPTVSRDGAGAAMTLRW